MKQFLVSLLAISALSLVSAQSNLPQRGDFYYEDGQMTLERMLNLTPNTNNAKNVILFVSDGAGPAIVTATRIFEGQLRGESGEENYLAFESFPYVAATKTYNTNAQTPDSAGTSTAMNTGVKTKQGVLGVNSNVLRGMCETQFGNETISLAAMAESLGMSTGVVSTARITHATPAAAYAHSVDRNWEDNDDLPEDAVALGCKDVASQLIDFPYGDGIDVAMGGGRRHFLPADMADPEDEGEVGNRTDGRNLPQEWVDGRDGATYVFDQAGFDAIEPASTGPVLGLFERSHMEYEYDRPDDTAGEPSLSEMTAKAIEILSRNDEGFFLTVESGRVDHAAHAGNAYRMLTDNVEFAEAVQVALDTVNLQDTLIIVTADHGHTVTLAGYAQRGNNILGLVRGLDSQGLPVDEPVLAADEKPYTSIGFINGPGAIIGERPELTQEEALDPEHRQQALIPLRSETHGGQDILTYATGPMAHLVGGVVEQSYFYHVMAHALDFENRLADAGVDITAMLPQPNQEPDTDDSDGSDDQASASQEGTGMAVAQADNEQAESEQAESAQTEEEPIEDAPSGSMMAQEPDLEMTISALEGGVGNIPLENAVELVQNWRTRLSSLEDPDLTPTINALDTLAASLGEENLDAAREAMMTLSEETASLAEANDDAMLQRLSELLSTAASN